MNPSQTSIPTLAKRALQFLLICVAAIGLVRGMLAFSGPQTTERAETRRLKIKDFEDMPIVVREVRHLQSESWYRDLEIEVRNVSSKSVYFILAYLIFPDDKAPNGESGIRLTYGEPKNILIRRVAPTDDLHLRPGEGYVFTIPNKFAKGLQSRQLKYPELHKNIELRFALVSFGDGTGFEVGEKRVTIKAIMGHREMKTTERYIRANRLTQQVHVLRTGHKLATRNKAASEGGRKL